VLGGRLPCLVPLLLATHGEGAVEWGVFIGAYRARWEAGFPVGRSSCALSFLGP